MIPEFPKFKPLELSDKEDVDKFTKKFPPYSDFNFVSMWSWNIEAKMGISQLNNNLVVRFNDYITGEPFYSFLGNNMVNETVEKIIQLSKKEGVAPVSQLVPEDSIKGLDIKKYNIIEDRDHFDYILDLKKISELAGKKFTSRRKAINKLLRNFNCDIQILEKISDENSLLISRLIEEIENQKKYDPLCSPIRREIEAVKRILSTGSILKLVIILVFVNKKLKGFAIMEIINSNYSIGHFLKAESKVLEGVYCYLMQELAKILLERKSKFINIEQDMGIQGLRIWKNSYAPDHFLKKYKVINI